MSSFLSSSSSSSSSALLFFFLSSFGFFFTKIFFFFWFLLGFYLHFLYKYVYTCFFINTLNLVLDKCTWYLTEQHWGIIRTIQMMRYYTYLNAKYGYLNNHALVKTRLSWFSHRWKFSLIFVVFLPWILLLISCGLEFELVVPSHGLTSWTCSHTCIMDFLPHLYRGWPSCMLPIEGVKRGSRRLECERAGRPNQVLLARCRTKFESGPDSQSRITDWVL